MMATTLCRYSIRVQQLMRVLVRDPGKHQQLRSLYLTTGCRTSNVLAAGLLRPDGTSKLSGWRMVHSAKDQVSAKAAAAGQSISLNCCDSGDHVTLVGPKARSLGFYSTWLRYNCHCGECKQEHSGQKLLSPSQLLPKYTVSKAWLDGPKSLKLEFAEEADHVTTIPLDFLFENDYSRESREKQQRLRQPLVAKNGLPTLQYEDVVGSKTGLLRWLQNINDYGICLLKNVPAEEGMVKKIFDVVSTPSPINVAYSSSFLGLHMDLVYYESPPGVQLLHCLRFDECVEGGDSVFVDAYAVAEQMRAEHPQEFSSLVSIPATFQKIHFQRERPVYLKYRRPHIVLTPEGEITGIHWAPAFEGPLCVKDDDVRPYYKAYRIFAQMLEKFPYKMKTRLQPGDLVSFNNRRSLHARDAFTLNGGVRHLQGAYLHIDEFKSQLDVLQRQVGDGSISRRSFNQCFF